ncbi:MAG: DUF192 domain-containing protein [Spirochaetes bacterium]|nr:DUF192 domain-containing protein [Spirochaetota bacterium]
MRLLVTSLLLCLLINCGDKKYARIEIKDSVLEVEIADTEEKRALGLMNKSHLPENEGVLFVFDPPQKVSFWMKDTSIPLSIAFIDKDLKITEIRNMFPYDVVNRTISGSPVQFALEVNQGWFEKNGIRAGDCISIVQN